MARPPPWKERESRARGNGPAALDDDACAFVRAAIIDIAKHAVSLGALGH
jgi:hypothetical protein